MSRGWFWRVAIATSIVVLAVLVLLVIVALRSETVFIIFLEACLVVLGALGWVWIEDRRASAPERRHRRELARAYPAARVIRVRVDGWHRDRLDINPALDRKPPPPPCFRKVS